MQNMEGMFQSASMFNRDVSEWDVSRVENMDSMFREAASFKQTLCGAAWVNSKASKEAMFTVSRGSISRTVCTATTGRQHPGLPLTERELNLVRAPISTPVRPSTLTIASTNTVTCPKCGEFKRSGRVSCCAPGGSWYKSCGSAGNTNADHRWFEGLEALSLIHI